jgi:choice-of-anchor C domain-containing protein
MSTAVFAASRVPTSSSDRTLDCPWPTDGNLRCLPQSGTAHHVEDGSQGSYNCPDWACIVSHALNSGFYVDFHTQLYESGEMRGQLDRVTQFVANQGFDKPASYEVPRPAGQELDGWTVDSGDVDVVDPGLGLWAAQNGSQSVDLNGSVPGSVSQVIPTSQGVIYRLSFWLAGNPDCGPAVKTVKILWGGVSKGVRQFDTTGHSDASMGWVQKAIAVTAPAGATTKLTFQSTTTGSCGPVIDNVQLTPT